MHLLVNRYNRVKYDDNGVFSDLTQELTNWTAENSPLELVPGEDYFYMGAPHSFASRFFHVVTPNDNAAKLNVEYYSNTGNQWRTLKNINDETQLAGVPMSKSGFVSWDIPDDWRTRQIDGFPEVPDNQSNAEGGKNLFYWIRISSDIALNALTELRWAGLLWTNHDFLLSRWPSVLSTKYLPDGKTDWYEMIEMSTRDVGEDLNIGNIIDYEMQAKDISELANLTTLKTLVNILIPFRSSDSLNDMREDWKDKYSTAIRKRLKGIDKNKDEKVSQNEEQRPLTNTRIFRG